MFAYIVLMCFFSYVLSVSFPVIYEKEKEVMLSQSKLLENDKIAARSFPLLSAFMFLLPVLIYYLSGDMLLSVFCFLIAIVGYTDLSARWIPDILIYLTTALSVYLLHGKDILEATFSIIFFIAPAVFLSFYGLLRRRENWIASGDYYLFPAIGAMIAPEFAATIMLISLVVTLVLTRWVEQVPLITVLYFTFMGYQICALSGVL